MGFFDRFKKKEKFDNNKTEPKQELNSVQSSITSDYKLQIDFYDGNADFRQFYDTTRLIIGDSLILAGHEVYDCKVSWYGRNDAVILDQNTSRECGRRVQYRDVLIELDRTLLDDQNYLSMLMTKLLEEKRVERYLEDGLEETPETYCGKYIGGVIKKGDNDYQKFFSVPVGEASHNSNLMVNRRKEHRENLEMQRQQDIAKKQKEILRLQQEINEMGRE